MKAKLTPSGSFGRCLTCYICGTSQIAVTLESHLNECKQDYRFNQQDLAPKDRKPLPREPKGLHSLLGFFFN